MKLLSLSDDKIKHWLRRLAVVSHDLVAVILCWFIAFSSRYGFDFSADTMAWGAFFSSLPVVVVIYGGLMWRVGLYNGVWRFASIPDLWNIIRAVFFGVLIVSLILFLFNRLQGVPRVTLLIFPILLVVFLGSPRLFYRLWKDYGLTLGGRDKKLRVLVIGAGRAGEMLVREMTRDPEYTPIGFLDDNVKLKNAKVYGLPVLGPVKGLKNISALHSVDLVIIAISNHYPESMRKIVECCEEAGVKFRTLPNVEDVVSGRSRVMELREVAIEDLLGRDSVAPDWSGISEELSGKVVVVSGGGGSIGSELCRQVCRLGPATLVIIEQSEFNLYTIEMELKGEFPALDILPLLIDVCDEVAIAHAFSCYRPDVVFHAAAYKHVPMLQTQVREAVKNNILGTRSLAMCADKYDCNTFILVSTDKAVNPTNVMGATKRVAEVFCQTLNQRSNTHFITVRFGNVLGSAGSVIPLFRKQIEQGGPITVTHPEIKRYFMTIPEASQLIMQASVLGGGGEIFVLDMGEPIKISYLAEQLIHLSGKRPGNDIEIKYTGLRPGEKLYEELFHDQEALVGTGHEKIFLAHCRVVNWDMVEGVLGDMITACENCDNKALLVLLQKLVPEMRQSGNDNNNIIPFERVTA